MRAHVVSLGLVMVLLLTSLTVGCSKSELVAASKDVISGLQLARPEFQKLGLNVAEIDTALSIAQQLETAFEQNASAKPVALISSLLDAFNAVSNQVTNNPAIQAILALADIGAHIIANAVSSSVSQGKLSATPATLRIEQFRSKRIWGCDYKTAKICHQ